MEEHAMKSFIELVSFDQKIRELQKNILVGQKNIEDFSTHIRKFQHELEEKKQELSGARKQLNDAELELKSTEMILNEKKTSLNRHADYKTLQSKKTEIERLENLQSEQERSVIDLVNRIDHLTKGFEKNSSDVAHEILTLEGHIQNKKKEIEQVEGMLANLQEERPSLFKDIPEEWLTTYNEMKEKVPDPVVPLSHDSCSGCFSMLTAADLQELRRNKLIACKLCYRLIYLP